MSSNPTQYYPTPPEAVIPLRELLAPRLARGSRLLDPCAGRGALPLFMGPDYFWDVLEMLPQFDEDLRELDNVTTVTTCNALWHKWPRRHVIANPPYGRELQEFAQRIVEHARGHEVIGAMLTRVTWWGEGTRSEFAPDVLLWIRGRISFTGDGKADSSSHCWAIWLPIPSDKGTRVVWCDKGQPSQAELEHWRRMLGLEGAQLPLWQEEGTA